MSLADLRPRASLLPYGQDVKRPASIGDPPGKIRELNPKLPRTTSGPEDLERDIEALKRAGWRDS